MLGQQITTSSGEKMTKILDLGDSKLSFWKPNCQAMLPTEEKNLDKAEWKINQNLIHKTLERVTSISESKGHAKKMEHPKGGDDGSLLDVLQRNQHLIVTFLEVQLEEHPRSIIPRGKISDVGERITIRNSNGIHPPIISARSPTTFFLLNHMKRRSSR